jgi:hypothetical protein
MKRIMITVAAVLAVAACGSTGSGNFGQQFSKAQQPLENLLNEPHPPVSDGPAYAASMTKLANGLEDVEKNMRVLYAPAGHEKELETFVKELHASSSAAREAAKALRARDGEITARALLELQQRLKRATDAEAELQNAAE